MGTKQKVPRSADLTAVQPSSFPVPTIHDPFLESYRTLTDALRLGVFRTTPGPHGTFLDVNPALVTMLGCTSRGDLLGIPVSRFYLDPGDRARFSEKLSERGLVKNEELTLRRKDGSLLIVSEVAVAVRDTDGQIMYFDGLVEDITEQKHTESRFDIQKAYLEKLFNAAPEAIALHNEQDRIVDINDEFTRVFGYTREEAIGKQINELVAPPSLLEEATDISRRVIGGERIELESKRKRKDGSLIDVSILGAPIVHNGVQIGDYAIYRDISERKHSEANIRIHKTYLESLLNSAPEAIAFHDNNDIVVNVNDEFVRLFGYSKDEAIGKPINDLVAPPSLISEAHTLSSTVIHGQRVEVESRRQAKDGRVFDVSILGAPILHEGKQIGVYAIYRDITDRKREEESRIREKEEARMARDIQMNFLPKANPVVEGYDIAGLSTPAANVGGDYYDFIRLDEHRIAIGLGDVSGHGIAASLVMANVQATIRSQALSGSDAAHCLERANMLLYNSTDARTFVSLFYGILDTKHHSLSYANAGQDLPVLLSEGREPRVLSARGMALGLVPDTSYDTQIISIRPGDRLLIYTDGVAEAMNESHEPFGEERITACAVANPRDTSSSLLSRLFEELHSFLSGDTLQDDMTAVAIRRSM